MNITEKASYIKGLMEGMDLDSSKKEVKLISAMLDLLDDMALTISDIEEEQEDLRYQIDEIDEDLASVEKDFYEDEDYLDDGEDLFYEVTCPTCNETVCLSENMLLEGEIDCPNCGETLEFDFDNICSDDCECGCHDHDGERSSCTCSTNKSND